MTSLFLNLEMVNASLRVLPLDWPLPLLLPRMSDAEFDQFCRLNRDLRIERNSIGQIIQIIVMSPTFSDTGNRNVKVSAQVFNWAEIDGTGEVFDSSTGFTLPNGAMWSPDPSWIQFKRWNALSPEEQASFAPIVPDFVIELRSSSDTLNSLQEKMQEYIE